MEKTIELRNITKTFGPVVANKNACLTVHSGEIMALLGENGSGKTTLMNMLSGLYYPDSGKIFINGKSVYITSPKDAFDYGIGMVHQHFKLIDVFTAGENVVLGLKDHFFINKKPVTKKIQSLLDRYGFVLDLNKKIYDMSVSEKQTVEIIKVLYRGADTLILDEPTAVLTPQETERLFVILRNMRNDGKTIIIITHKMQEVLSLSDEVAILRKGEIVKVVETKDANQEELADLMVGAHVALHIDRDLPVNPTKVLSVNHLTCYNEEHVKSLDNVSFDAYSGEILGIAGVSGSGQKALLEAISGLQKTEEGSNITFFDEKGKSDDLVGKDPKIIKHMGVSLAFVPEDRLGMGLVGDMGMVGNMLLRSYDVGKTPFIEVKKPAKLASILKEKLEVLTPSIDTPVRNLSGGNVQKVLVGRELASQPRLLLTAYAVRGLDINTSYTIYNILNYEKKQGMAIVYVGEDLDVLLALTDRILVLSDGKVTGIVDSRTTDKKKIGQLMASSEENKEHD
jgi:simple sugar transport system ATP-binding protein